jgi:predicted phosphatase
MKWFKRKVLQWLQEAQMEQLDDQPLNSRLVDMDSVEDDSGHKIDMGKSVRFSVLPARGGCVIEIKSWNQKDHEWDIIAHIIPEGEDIAHRVGQLVSMEFLRR